MGHECGVTTLKGRPCRRWLVRVQYCYHHRLPSPRRQPEYVPLWQPTVRRGGDRFVGPVTDFAADVVASGQPLVVASGRIGDLAGAACWDALVRDWKPGSCRTLANAARRIDAFRGRLHEVVGETVAGLVVPARVDAGDRFCHAFIARTVGKVGLPFDAKLASCALGLRLAGIALCAVRFRDIGECACLKDLFVDQAREITSAAVSSKAEDWLRQDANLR